MKRTALHGFYRRTADDRLAVASKLAGLGAGSSRALRSGLDMSMADSLVENAVGVFALPLGIATNFRVNGRDVLVPMVTEEPSVIAAASAGAKAASDVCAKAAAPHIIGQLQVLEHDVGAVEAVEARKADVLTAANESLSDRMSAVGVSCSTLAAGQMKVEIVVDAGEAMGANAVNTMCEAVAPLIVEMTGGRVLLRILSNASPNLVSAEATFEVTAPVAEDMVNAYRFALFDRNRAVTHNKGIMNGVTAVGLATGQDTRAIEAGAHAYAADRGAGSSKYGPLSEWEISDGLLRGRISIPLRVGTVGGLTARHPTAAACLGMMGNPGAGELACIMAAVGLCQNFSALKALVTDGIQKGHMRLHMRRLHGAH